MKTYSRNKHSSAKKILLFCLLILPFVFSGCTKSDGSPNALGQLFNSLGINTGNPGTASADNPADGHKTALSDTPVPATVVPTDSVPTETPIPTPTVFNLQLWVPPQFDTAQDTPGGKALASAIAAYMAEHPNVNITLRVKATQGDASMLNTITAANHIAKDVLPTLALVSRNDMEVLVQRGLLQPIVTEIFTDNNTWYGYSRQSAVVDNTVYSIPILGDGLVLTYRNAKTGTDLGDWQDILTRGMPIGFAPSSSTSLFGPFIYLSQGGKLTNDQGQAYLDQLKLTDTLNFFLTGGQNGAFPPSIAQLVDQAQVWQRFNEGTMSIIITPFSSYRHYQEPGISVRSLPLQTPDDGYPLVSTWNLVLLEDKAELQGEAVKFAEYLGDIAINDTLSVNAGYFPVRNNDHPAWAEDAQKEIVTDIAEHAILVPNNYISGKIVPLINTAVSQVIRNQMSPEDAAKDAAASLN